MIGPKTAASWYEGEITGGFIATPEGGLELALLDRWPDWQGQDLSLDGTPAGWLAPLPDEVTHYHVQESRPGKRTAQSAPAEEKEPPRLDTMTRQTAALVPGGEAWAANQPAIIGYSPYHAKSDPHAASVEPLAAPEVEVMAVAGGYAGGITPVGFTLGNENGETTASGFAFVTLASGEGYRLYLLEGLQGGARGPLSATTFSVYQGKPGGGVISARKQEEFRIDELQDPYVEMRGPYKDTGKKPPTKNQSGIGRPPQPAGHSPNRARFSKRKARGKFALQPGDYRAGLQKVKGGGRSLVSQWSREITVNQEEEGVALVFEAPRSLSEARNLDERFVPWITKDDVPMRVYKKTGGLIEGEAYKAGATAEIYGYAADAEPKGLKDGLVEATPPDPSDPSADTTAIEPPDPNTPPDEPVPIGVSIERGQPSQAFVAVSGVTEDGREAARSRAVKVTLAALQTYRVRPQPPVGQLANARFSDITPDGKPSLWTLLNLPAGRYVADAGGLTMLQPVTIGGDFPAAQSLRPLPITPDTTVTFVGSVAVLRRQGGIARLVAEELDEVGVVVRATYLKSITSGKSSLGARGFRMGAGTAIPWHADAVSVRYVGRMGLGADASVNMDMRVEGLEMFPFAAAPRAFSRLEDGSVTFEPGPAVPHPDRSHLVVGEAPIPAGGATETVDPALSHVSFDSGAFNPSPSTGWTSESGGGATATVSPAAALHGPFGVEVKSDNTNARSYNRRRYDAGGGRTSLAIRQPVRAVRGTNRDEVWLHTINDAQGIPMATIRHTASNTYIVEVLGPNGGVLTRRTVLRDDGPAYDLELLVDTSGGAKNGRVVVGASYFGAPREILAEIEGLNFTGRSPRYAFGQVYSETNIQARWTYHFDEIVTTPGGDVTDREAPALPAGETPEDPDAPAGASPGDFRLYHSGADGKRVRQSALFLRPGTRPGTYGPQTDEPIPVKPGQDFTVAVFGFHSKFGELRDVPSYPFGVILKGPGKEPLWLGSPYGELFVGESPWQEWWKVYSVPGRTGPDDPGYTECHIESREMADMYALWQEGDFADGALTSAAARDLARTLARKTNGSVRVTIDSRAPDTVHTPSAYTRRRWASFGVQGVGIGPPRYRSGPSASGPWTGEVTNPALTPEDAFLQIAFDAVPSEATDGISEVPPGGVYLGIAQDIALLQNEVGEDLPGLGVIGELLPDYTRGNYAVKEINGKPFAAKISDDVRKLPGFVVSVYTEDAARTLLECSPNDRFRIPDPHADNGAGRDFLVRLSDVLEIEDKEPPTDIKDGIRRVLASFAVPYAHVLEAAPLERAR